MMKHLWILSIAMLFASACAGQGDSAGISPPSPMEDHAFALGGSFTTGTRVGEFELSAPAGDSTQGNAFILHGTLPIAKGAFSGSPGSIWLGVVDFDGAMVPAQLERVTRYATGEPAIFEVIARVHRDPNKTAGTRVVYPVHLLSDPTSSSFQTGGPVHNVPTPIRDLLSGNRDFLITAKDVFGNSYFTQPLGSGNQKMHRDGPYQGTLRAHSILNPLPKASGPQGTLDHLLGVHSYMSYWDGENTLGVDLRLHNGLVGSNPAAQDPIRLVYFKQISVCVPLGYTVENFVRDPFWDPTGRAVQYFGKSYMEFDLVKPLPNGKMHVMQKQGQMERRFAITPLGNEPRARALLDQEGLAFCRDGMDPSSNERLWSWWNPQTANFMQGNPLPSLAFWGAQTLRTELTNKYHQSLQIMESGNESGIYPWFTPVLGWAMPSGVAYQGMTNSNDLSQDTGVKEAYAASASGVLDAQLRQIANAARQPWALFNPDGSPIQLEQLLKTKSGGTPYIPFQFFMLPEGDAGLDYFKLQEPPNFHENFVNSTGKNPDYEQALLAFMCHDFQHGMRYFRYPLILLFLNHDPMAKDDLHLTANIARLNEPEVDSCFNGCANGMFGALQFTSIHPGKASADLGRGQAWGLLASSLYFAAASDSWRAQNQPWYHMTVDVARRAQIPCNGVFFAQKNDKWLNNGRERQGFEQQLFNTALRSLRHNVYEGTGNARETTIQQILVESAYSFIRPIAWWAGHGPWKYLSVGPLNVSAPVNCSLPLPPNSVGSLDNTYLWDTLAYGYELTQDSEFLNKAIEASGGTMTSFKHMLETVGYYSDLDHNAYMLYLMQTLGFHVP